jgi:hypothetical protein
MRAVRVRQEVALCLGAPSGEKRIREVVTAAGCGNTPLTSSTKLVHEPFSLDNSTRRLNSAGTPARNRHAVKVRKKQEARAEGGCLLLAAHLEWQPYPRVRWNSHMKLVRASTASGVTAL